MRKHQKSIRLHRETLHALTVEAAELRAVAGGFATVRTCGTPCTKACTNSCSDCCSAFRTGCAC